MTSKEYLNVHELASLFGLNVQTLHYYDKVGVFKPSDRDPGNRYRKYRFDQIYELASIRYMRKLGYSVGAVREFQDTREPDVSLKRLKERSAAIRAQWEELMRIDQAIMRKVQFIEECRDEIEKDVDLNGFKIVEFPERRYIPIGTENEIFTGESFYFYPTIVFYGKDTKQFGALLTEDQTEDTTCAVTSTIPAGEYLVGYHRGPYEQIQESFDRIRSYGSQYKLDDTMLAVNIIDQFVEKKNANYMTRIEIRIL